MKTLRLVTIIILCIATTITTIFWLKTKKQPIPISFEQQSMNQTVGIMEVFIADTVNNKYTLVYKTAGKPIFIEIFTLHKLTVNEPIYLITWNKK